MSAVRPPTFVVLVPPVARVGAPRLGHPLRFVYRQFRAHPDTTPATGLWRQGNPGGSPPDERPTEGSARTGPFLRRQTKVNRRRVRLYYSNVEPDHPRPRPGGHCRVDPRGSITLPPAPTTPVPPRRRRVGSWCRSRRLRAGLGLSVSSAVGPTSLHPTPPSDSLTWTTPARVDLGPGARHQEGKILPRSGSSRPGPDARRHDDSTTSDVSGTLTVRTRGRRLRSRGPDLSLR